MAILWLDPGPSRRPLPRAVASPSAFAGIFAVWFAACPPALAISLGDAIDRAAPPVRMAYTYLHENPELGKHETKAQSYLRGALQSLGFADFITSVEAPTSVIAVLDSGKPGPVVALRAELDARPLEAGAIEPASHVPRSLTDGVMHNCGHDVHAAILLGVAAILINNKERLIGKVVFLFQPAEETAGGADDIVREHILDRLGVQSIFAEHVAPGLPVGTVAIAPGYALAGSNYFQLKIKGKGSHAAMPSEGTDTPLVAARMAIQLAEYPARHLDIANWPVVISVTRLLADGKAGNVIPADAELSGTVRSFADVDHSAEGGPPLRQRLEGFVAKLATQAGVDHEWTLRPGAPPTRNDMDLFNRISKPLAQSWPGRFDSHPGRGMFSEDFAYYTQSIPALYFSIGIAKDGRGNAGVHTKDFDVHEDVFAHGLRLMTTLAVIATTGRMDWQ